MSKPTLKVRKLAQPPKPKEHVIRMLTTSYGLVPFVIYMTRATRKAVEGQLERLAKLGIKEADFTLTARPPPKETVVKKKEKKRPHWKTPKKPITRRKGVEARKIRHAKAARVRRRTK